MGLFVCLSAEMRFSRLPPGRVPARGWSFPAIFTRADGGSSLPWLLLGPVVPLASESSLTGNVGLWAGPPWRPSPLNPTASPPPPRASSHRRAEEPSSFLSLDLPLTHTHWQAAQGQPRLLGHRVSHTQIIQTGQTSNSQARQGEVKRLRPHPPSAGESKHESVSNVKRPNLLLKHPQGDPYSGVDVSPTQHPRLQRVMEGLSGVKGLEERLVDIETPNGAPLPVVVLRAEGTLGHCTHPNLKWSRHWQVMSSTPDPQLSL